MKIIHCADVHLDSKLRTNLSIEKARERNNEILITFERLVEYAKDNQVDAILIAGDLFDTANVTAKTKNTVSALITQHPFIEFFYLKGNHDVDNFITSWDELPENLKVFTKEWESYDIGTVTITGIELDETNKDNIYDTLLLDKQKINVVILHGQETKYKGKDQAEEIHIGALKNHYIDYLALGHIHSYKVAPIDMRGTYCYAGCLEGRGYDECGEKGFVLVTIEEGKLKHQFIPFATRIIEDIHVDITNCNTTEQIDKRMEQALENSKRTSLIKVSLEGKTTIDSERDISYLTKKWEDRFYAFKIEDENVRLLIDPKEYQKDASLKGEFIRLVSGLGLPEEEESAVITMGLRALSGEAVDL